jgi:hypothetical protein
MHCHFGVHTDFVLPQKVAEADPSADSYHYGCVDVLYTSSVCCVAAGMLQ